MSYHFLSDGKCPLTLHRFLWLEATDIPLSKSEELKELASNSPIHCLFDVIPQTSLALDLLASLPYSAIFVHTAMREMDFRVFVRTLRQSEVPVRILLVGSCDEVDVLRREEEEGAVDGSLVEPIGPEALGAVLEMLARKED